MKVWAKVRKLDASDCMIFHSQNIAHAVYGFRELGAEIIPYETIDEIYNWVSRDDVVLDYIDQCNTIFHKFGVTPSIPDYPEQFEKFLGRKIWRDTINSISSDEKKWSAGWFVKPVRDKAFTGKIIKSIADLVGCGSSTENYEVLCSEPLDIKSEWRCFIMYDKIVDIRPYGLLMHNNTEPNWKYHYDSKVVEEMLDTFIQWEDRPMACSMDIAVANIQNCEKTVLVEFNDAYALGNYGLPSIYYAKLISARWSQLLNRPDEYLFNI